MTDYNVLIDTPENLTLEAEVAGFGSRSIAALMDYTLLFVVEAILFVLLIRAAVNLGGGNSAYWAIGAFILFQFLMFAIYHLFFEYIWNGQTPGKRAVGLRVVQSNGMPLTTSGLVIRNLARLFDFFPIFYGVGLVTLFFTKYSQRLGDMAASTIVIYDREDVTLDSLKITQHMVFIHIRRDDPELEPLDISPLNEADHQLINNYLMRRRDLQKRGTLVVPLAKKITDKLGMVDTHNAVDAEKLLERIALAYEQRRAV